VAVAAGGDNTLALLGDGRVMAWGANEYGSLGLGKAKDVATPTEVPDLGPSRAIATALWHSCAALNDGTARCWGRNFGGRLGDGTIADRMTPSPVVDIAGVTAIATGDAQTAAVAAENKGFWWGMITAGNRPRPSEVEKLPPVAAFALAGERSCARLIDGHVWCWNVPPGLDFNYGDAVGTGDGNIKKPREVAGLSDVIDLAVSTTHACAVARGGALWCWGKGKDGQMGDGKSGGGQVDHDGKGTFLDGYTLLKPARVPSIGPVARVAVSTGATCAALETGAVSCWGANGWGQLGAGDKKPRTRPAEVPSLTDAVSIAMGESHTCALSKAGAVTCWGSDLHGQLGDGKKGISATRTSPGPRALE
jgi:alpha-tubulin suppressor-like RCC1 family protein